MTVSDSHRARDAGSASLRGSNDRNAGKTPPPSRVSSLARGGRRAPGGPLAPRNLIDSLRAGRSAVPLARRWFAVGHVQGANAAGAASQLARSNGAGLTSVALSRWTPVNAARSPHRWTIPTHRRSPFS